MISPKISSLYTDKHIKNINRLMCN